jgi:hypothetical protein
LYCGGKYAENADWGVAKMGRVSNHTLSPIQFPASGGKHPAKFLNCLPLPAQFANKRDGGGVGILLGTHTKPSMSIKRIRRFDRSRFFIAFNECDLH